MRPSRRASALRGIQQPSHSLLRKIISFTTLKIQCINNRPGRTLVGGIPQQTERRECKKASYVSISIFCEDQSQPQARLGGFFELAAMERVRKYLRRSAMAGRKAVGSG